MQLFDFVVFGLTGPNTTTNYLKTWKALLVSEITFFLVVKGI